MSHLWVFFPLHAFPVIGFQRRDPDEDGDDVRFPEGLDDLTNTSFDSIPAKITLPPALFKERRMPGSESSRPLALLHHSHNKYYYPAHMHKG